MPKIVGFNYKTLPSELRRAAQEAATAIKNLEERRAADAVEIGRILLQMRDKLSLPQFHAWCKAEVKMAKNTVRDYEMIARRFDKLDGATMQNFQRSAAKELARGLVPDEARAEAIDLARRGEVVTRGRALEIIGRFESAPRSGQIQLPTPTRVEIHRARSALRRALETCPSAERGQLVRDLHTAIDELAGELAQRLAEDTRDAAPIAAGDIDEALLAAGAVG